MCEEINPMSTTGAVFDEIDALHKRIRQQAIEPEFSEAVKKRDLGPQYDVADKEVVRTMIELIAFSQGARADRIGDMRNRGVFREVFGAFDPATVAQMDPKEIYKKHWSGKLSPMRFPDKIDKMVDCAKSVREIALRKGSFLQSLQASHIRDRIRSNTDIDAFWNAFELARSKMPPFFQNFISLCHLFQAFRFPCAKPDKVVMSVAAELGIIAPRKQYREPDLKNVVRVMQSYAAQREISVPNVTSFFSSMGSRRGPRRSCVLPITPVEASGPPRQAAVIEYYRCPTADRCNSMVSQ
jgi:hypothetical protein